MINKLDLSEIVKLARGCDGPQRNYSVAAYRRIVVPAMEVGQYEVVPDKWFATWAFFTPEQVQQFMQMQEIDKPWTDRPGTVLWLIDLVTHPSVDRSSLVPYLMRADWMTKTRHEYMYYARSYGARQFHRVGWLPRRYADASASVQ